MASQNTVVKQALLPPEVERFSRSLGRTRSLVDQVHLLLREMIIAGRLQPGDRIVESKIAKQLEVGQPTVRDALRSLESEGLVEHRRNRGCSVIRFTQHEFAQIFRLRLEWEPLAAELALEERTAEKPAALSAAAEALLDAARRESVEDFYRADLAFHHTLWRCSNNSFLERALLQITTPLFAFVMVHLMRDQVIDLEAGAKEHIRIVEALERGNVKHARKVVREVLRGFQRQGETEVASLFKR